MRVLRCRACGGTYQDTQDDGTTYFHACAPLSSAELQAAVDAGRVTLPPGETCEQAVQRRSYERHNARDENVPSTRAVDSGRLKLAGDGVDDAGTRPPPRVIVAAHRGA